MNQTNLKTIEKNPLVLALTFCVAAVLLLLVINKFETTPSAEVQVPASSTGQLVPQSPEGAVLLRKSSTLSSVTNQVPAQAEYPKQVMIPLLSWSDTESAKKIITDNGGKILRILKWPMKNVIIAILPDRNAELGILKNTFWGKLVGVVGLSSFGNSLSGGIDAVEKDTRVYAQTTQSFDWGIGAIGAYKVWGVSTGKGVKVAVIDSGIQRTHPDLAANIKGGINFVVSAADGQVHPDQWDDESGHGTEVAGIIAAANNDIGYVGVAPEASLYAVKVMGANDIASMSDVLSGIYWAGANGMNVANLSLGTWLSSAATIAEETAAVNYAYARGVVLVASSGNSPGGDCSTVIYPAAITGAVIAVGATTPDNSVASFSCHGPEVELAAPGVGNWAPTLEAYGSYAQHAGTSVAAPFVAGVAALILQQNPQFTPAQVRSRLDSTAFDIGAPGKDDYSGYGLVNAHDAILPPNQPVVITILSPQGGETWPEGLSEYVKWAMKNVTSDSPVTAVDIQLLHQHDGTTDTIPLALNAANDGDAAVTIPTGLPGTDGSNSYFLQIGCGKEYLGKCEPVQSEYVTLTATPPQALQIISPNGGERWPQGTTQTVRWSANYSGGPNVTVDLLKKTQVPSYSLSSAVDGWATRATFSWTAFGGAEMWGSYNPPPDTCDGNKASRADGGVFSCPATYSASQLNCLDVAQGSVQGYYYGGYVKCTYQQTGSTAAIVPVKTLSADVPNTGSAKVSVPADLLGDNYLIQLSCSNFTGDCGKGLSNAPFSIIQLTDPVDLTITKVGTGGSVSDGNMVCGGDQDACAEQYERGAVINLAPLPSTDPTVIFAGWSGACSGTSACQVTMGSSQAVTAVFSKRVITLMAVADPGATFTGWSGACLSNNGCFTSWSSACPTSVPCNITMSSDQVVTPNFVKNPLSPNAVPPGTTNLGVGAGGSGTGGSGGGSGSGGSSSQASSTLFIPGQLHEINP